VALAAGLTERGRGEARYPWTAQEKEFMADDRTKTAPQDAQRVNVDEDYEVQYWSEKWGFGRRTEGGCRQGGAHGQGRGARPGQARMTWAIC
jgi:hypothetical protein